MMCAELGFELGRGVRTKHFWYWGQIVMRVERRFTSAAESPYAGLDLRTTTSEIRNPDGSVVFQLENIEVPAAWSQVACDIIAQKYFRKAGVAARLRPVEEDGVPSWLLAH